ncbi:UNVERIFIED_CONTAM: hypothetical protein FKN15_031238 [Acipenser sinensis]
MLQQRLQEPRAAFPRLSSRPDPEITVDRGYKERSRTDISVPSMADCATQQLPSVPWLSPDVKQEPPETPPPLLLKEEPPEETPVSSVKTEVGHTGRAGSQLCSSGQGVLHRLEF